MPNGFYPGSTGGAYNWDEIFRQRMAAQGSIAQNRIQRQLAQANPNYRAGDGGSGSPAADALASGRHPLQQTTPSGGAVAAGQGMAQQTRSGSVLNPARPSGAPTNQAGQSGTYGQGIIRGSIDPDRTWWGDSVNEASMATLQDDPEQANYQWAQQMGYGRGIEGQLASYVDPTAIGLATGANMADPQSKLAWIGGFNQMATGAAGQESALDPRSIAQRVFTASPEAGGEMDTLGVNLYGGANATNMSGQVGTTLKFLQASLSGLVSPVVLNSYLTMIEDQGRAFLAHKMSPEGAKDDMNFGQWVAQRLGPSGGL